MSSSSNINNDSYLVGIVIVGIEGSEVGNVERGIPSRVLPIEGGLSRRSRRGIVYLLNFLSTWRKASLSIAYLSSRGFNSSEGSNKVLLTLDEVAVVLDEEGPYY